MDNENIIKIGDTGFSEGYEYKVLERIGDLVLIGRGHGGNYNWNYEVHKIRTQKASKAVFNGKEAIFKEKELLAKAEQFGEYGWAYSTIEEVKNKWFQFKDVKI